MSRHNTSTIADGVIATFAYGYDGPLQEYFLQLSRIKIKIGKLTFDIIANEEIVGTLSNKYGSGVNLLEAIEELDINVPEEHRDEAGMDIPINNSPFGIDV
jgi:hypothetical protein